MRWGLRCEELERCGMDPAEAVALPRGLPPR